MSPIFRILFTITVLSCALANSFAEENSPLPWPKRRASELVQGYRFEILKPIPRHNNRCETIFKNGKVTETCDGNWGFDPKRYGAVRTHCRWQFMNEINDDQSKAWTEPFFTNENIAIVKAIDFWKVLDIRDNNLSRIRNTESIKDRHLKITFNLPEMGELNCYAGILKAYRKNSDYYYGAKNYDWSKAKHPPAFSGLSIEDVQKQLGNFIRITPIE